MTMMTAPPTVPDLLGTSPADLLVDAERRDSTPEEARQRAERLRAGIVRYSEMRQDIADAFAARDWLALGYNNWADYVDAEFGEQLAQLARGERRQAVQDLRSQGLSTRRIASVTGASRNTIAKQVAHIEPPEKVTGSDGKTYSAIRPVPQAPEPERPTPPKWDPEERRQHEEDIQRRRDIEAAHRFASNIVTDFRSAVVTIVSGCRLGEPGLITPDMIRDLRQALDLLEAEL